MLSICSGQMKKGNDVGKRMLKNKKLEQDQKSGSGLKDSGSSQIKLKWKLGGVLAKSN